MPRRTFSGRRFAAVLAWTTAASAPALANARGARAADAQAVATAPTTTDPSAGMGSAHLPPPAGSDAAKPPSTRPPAPSAPASPRVAPPASTPLPQSQGQTQGQEALAAALEQVLARPALRQGRVGVVVRRLDSGKTLFARGGATQLVPASNVKIVTTAAALDALSPDFRFQTEIYGALDTDGVVQGDLTLKGYGDPYLIPERMAYLASRLRLRGVNRVAGDLAVDDAFFADEAGMALGWQEDKSSRAYMAPAGALSVGFNALMVQVAPDAANPAAAQVLFEPRQRYAQLDVQLQPCTVKRRPLDVNVLPRGQGSVVSVRGSSCPSDPPRTFWRRIDRPAYFAGEVARQALRDEGIEVTGKVVRRAAPLQAPLLLTFGSPRLAELLVPLNKFSNNFMAMQLALVLGAFHHGAPATWPKAKRALDAFMTRKVGVPAHAYSLQNASGLHGVNTLSAEQLVAVLAYVARQPGYRTEFVNSLATAAGSGTLQERMLDGPAAARVRAKTGTLAQASALSGYVDTASGVPLAFSLLVNGYRHIDAVWAAQDAFAEALASAELTPELPPPAPPSRPPPTAPASPVVSKVTP